MLSAVRSCPPGDAPRLLLAADRRGRSTALSYAAERGSEPIVRALLQLVERETVARRSARCSFLDAADTYGRTPLSYACDRGHAAIVQRLLEAGSAAINTPDAYGTRPLRKAAAFGRAAVLRQLLARADVELDATVGVPTVDASFEAKSGEDARRRRPTSPRGRAPRARSAWGCCWRPARTRTSRRSPAKRRCTRPSTQAASQACSCCLRTGPRSVPRTATGSSSHGRHCH